MNIKLWFGNKVQCINTLNTQPKHQNQLFGLACFDFVVIQKTSLFFSMELERSMSLRWSVCRC